MSEKAPKFSRQARRKARKFVLQALYQWQLSGTAVSEIEQHYLLDEHVQKADVPYFQDLFNGIMQNLEEVDGALLPFLDRPIQDLNPVELAIIRIGTYELLERKDVPYRVVINEALELTKTFGAEAGYKYVNGVLDKIARRVRATEIKVASHDRAQ